MDARTGHGRPPERANDPPAEGERLPREQQDALILQYGPLVRKIASSLSLRVPGVFEFEDAVAAGNYGLVEAVRRYDPGRGASFYAFASHRIRGAMLDAFRSLDRLSRSMRRRVQDADRVLDLLQGELGRAPTDREVADALGIPLRSYREARAAGRGVAVSLEGLLERDPSRVESMLSDRGEGVEEQPATHLERQEIHESLSRAIKTLPPRDQQILALYYAEQLTMREIAQILGVSETRISQRHARIIRHLRGALAPLAA